MADHGHICMQLPAQKKSVWKMEKYHLYHIRRFYMLQDSAHITFFASPEPSYFFACVRSLLHSVFAFLLFKACAMGEVLGATRRIRMHL